MNEVLVGFDSAWADNPRNPGAITALVLGGAAPVFHPPVLATFDQALGLIGEWAPGADYLLVAIDQPTVVPNFDGARPVDRVAASLISRMKGGVQPARRGGIAAPLFGDGAPIWRFLGALGAVHDPLAARNAHRGRFVAEVFPALALPAMIPELWLRRRGAKYNPMVGSFAPLDWMLAAGGVASYARGLGAAALADWLECEAVRIRPRKAHQDRLDAAICLAIALGWRHGPAEATLQIGDARSGLMAAIVSAETRAILETAAAAREVAFVSGDEALFPGLRDR